MRAPAPRYCGEGPHALWHVSEDATIRRFAPHVSRTAASQEPRVWAVDTRHLPLYWFPRECPRGTFWAARDTRQEDAGLLGGASRVHLVERGWVAQIRSARVVAFRLPEAGFDADAGVGDYWLSRTSVEPVQLVKLGDLIERHERAGIELRVVDEIWTVWERVVASTLEFSGIRLHNAARVPG